ncbi:MFS transporter [Enterococcus sp. HY326]|uniref:MFS transporter n=1 Tax=Enterococcus sp. HY326 TaxID=2971265 RepID=UPI0022409DAE|nr:MFS transporter [Enterococcus sp. HY326]
MGKFKNISFTSLSTTFFGIFVTNISTFMLSAFWTIYLSQRIGLTASQIGLVLTLSLISQRGFTFFGGLLGDRIGTKTVLVSGLLLRAVGYFSYLFATSLPLIILSSILVGLGGALKDPTLNAAVVLFADKNRLMAFTGKAMMGNLAQFLGPLLATFCKTNYQGIFLITTITHLLFAFLISQQTFSQKTRQSNEKKRQLDLTAVFQDQQLITLTLITSGFWFLYSQFTLTIPLYISNFFSNDNLISMVYSLDGVLALVLQMILLGWLQKFFSLQKIFILASFILATAFFWLALGENVAFLMLFTFCFSLGVMCIIPIIDDLTATIAPNQHLATYLGFVSFGWGIGGTLGNLLGGRLFELFFQRRQIKLLWLIFLLIGLGLAFAVTSWSKLAVKRNDFSS